MSDMLIFWKARPDMQLPPAAIARDLLWGEDVEGLIDLPVKEILDRLKTEFPQYVEKPGLLTLDFGPGRGEVTWSWQHLQVDAAHASPADRAIEQVLGEFGCQSFSPSS